jgi:hypothetical protein
MTRQDVLDLMAYDLHFGLPDKQERKIPAAPARRIRREHKSVKEQLSIVRSVK